MLGSACLAKNTRHNLSAIYISWTIELCKMPWIVFISDSETYQMTKSRFRAMSPQWGSMILNTSRKSYEKRDSRWTRWKTTFLKLHFIWSPRLSGQWQWVIEQLLSIYFIPFTHTHTHPNYKFTPVI